jgi:hypothetical protein
MIIFVSYDGLYLNNYYYIIANYLFIFNNKGKSQPHILNCDNYKLFINNYDILF